MVRRSIVAGLLAVVAGAPAPAGAQGSDEAYGRLECTLMPNAVMGTAANPGDNGIDPIQTDLFDSTGGGFDGVPLLDTDRSGFTLSADVTCAGADIAGDSTGPVPTTGYGLTVDGTGSSNGLTSLVCGTGWLGGQVRLWHPNGTDLSGYLTARFRGGRGDVALHRTAGPLFLQNGAAQVVDEGHGRGEDFSWRPQVGNCQTSPVTEANVNFSFSLEYIGATDLITQPPERDFDIGLCRRLAHDVTDAAFPTGLRVAESQPRYVSFTGRAVCPKDEDLGELRPRLSVFRWDAELEYIRPTFAWDGPPALQPLVAPPVQPGFVGVMRHGYGDPLALNRREYESDIEAVNGRVVGLGGSPQSRCATAHEDRFRVYARGGVDRSFRDMDFEAGFEVVLLRFGGPSEQKCPRR